MGSVARDSESVINESAVAKRAEFVELPKSVQFLEITCNLIPVSQAVAIVAVLVGVSTISWFTIAVNSSFGVISAIFQFMAIPVIIHAAMKLKLRLSQDGLTAKSGLHRESMYNRNTRSWDDLHSVRLRKLISPKLLLERMRNTKENRLARRHFADSLGSKWMQEGFLIMDFTSGGMIAFPLAGFSPESLENLFLALSRWADPMTLNPDVISLQRDILSGQTLQLSDSYTKMWEDSLRTRFEVTNFVPLVGGQELQDGALKILMHLACGGLSSVYLARDKQGNRCVVKEMAVPNDDGDTTLDKVHEMFAREAQFLARLDHPNIVKVKDHFVENSRDYLVLEFIPGLTLRQQVQMHGPFAEAEVKDIARQIAGILVYLHGNDPPIIHRDLTPDNLVVREPEKSICLIDFGAANEFISNVTGTLIGKQCYIPPEQFQGQAVPQSDLYALGATMHYLLTACDPEPISVSHPKQTINSISDEMNHLVEKLTETDPKERVQSASELLTLLERMP